jgi:hypothetical protein
MGWFGPSRDEVWRQLSEEIGAEVVQGGFWKGGSKVQAHFGPWIVTLDTYTVPSGHSHVTVTRIRVPYVNPEGFTVRDLSQERPQRLGQAKSLFDLFAAALNQLCEIGSAYKQEPGVVL